MGRPSNAELAQRKAQAEAGEQPAPAPVQAPVSLADTVVLTNEKVAVVEPKTDHGFKLGLNVTVDYKGKRIAAVVVDVKTINAPKLDPKGGYVFTTTEFKTSKGPLKRNIQLFDQLERFDVWGFHPAFQDKIVLRDLTAEQLTHI